MQFASEHKPEKKTLDMKDLNVVVAGRERDTIEFLASLTQRMLGCRPQLQHINNGHADPLYGHTETPDLLILDLAADWREQLGALTARPPAARPTTLVIGPPTQVDAMRLAMRAGARDYLGSPVAPAELEQALSLITSEESQRSDGGAHWVAVTGARGGVGASMIACNLATLLQKHASTLLIDLDLQAGSQAGYLDIEPRQDFGGAIDSVGELDEVALDGYVCRATSGLGLLASPSALILPEQIAEDDCARLFSLASTSFDWIVADVPRRLDHIGAAALELSTEVLLVIEQSVAALRDGLRFYDVLTAEVGLAASQISFVLNRWTRNSQITASQIQKNVGDARVLTIANDYRAVSESLNVGVPVVEHARASAPGKSLRQLHEQLTGHAPPPSLVRSLTSMLRS